MRPCGPEPLMRAMSMPASLARRRASGDEKTRAWPLVLRRRSRSLRRGSLRRAGCCGRWRGRWSGWRSRSGRLCGGASAAFGAGAAPAPAPAAFTSSPSPARTAMISLTGTSCVPSGTRIFAIVPSSTASTSIVALSVSISAITSPDLTLSPSFLSHLARLPFSIVGDSAGIKMLIGIVSDPVATGAWWSPCRSAG